MQQEQSTVEGNGAGRWCSLETLSWVRIAGSDAVRFVDSFTTAAVGKLSDGQGTESFFADVKGQVICMAGLLRLGPDRGEEPAVEIVVDGEVGSSLAEHLERYHIREPIEIEDVSAGRRTWALFGEGVLAALSALSAETLDESLLGERFGHVAVSLACEGRPVAARLVRCDWAGEACWLLVSAAGDADVVAQALAAAGLVACEPTDWERRCIEAGTPRLCDIVPKTLPQELGRDARAISFTKGCYLGQETVARLDALGHVNRRLAGLAVDGDIVPEVGAAITSGSDTVGQVTSSCFSKVLGKPLVLAILPVKALTSEALLAVGGVAAAVVTLPVAAS